MEEDDDSCSDSSANERPNPNDVGQKAKRQRSSLWKRLSRERLVDVGNAAGALHKFLIVTPSERLVEHEITEAARECVQQAIGAALEEEEAVLRAQEAERERLRLAQRARRDAERQALAATERKQSVRVAATISDVVPQNLTHETEMKPEEGPVRQAPAKLTTELIANLVAILHIPRWHMNMLQVYIVCDTCQRSVYIWHHGMASIMAVSAQYGHMPL